jgi:hypothetical protein
MKLFCRRDTFILLLIKLDTAADDEAKLPTGDRESKAPLTPSSDDAASNKKVVGETHLHQSTTVLYDYDVELTMMDWSHFFKSIVILTFVLAGAQEIDLLDYIST